MFLLVLVVPLQLDKVSADAAEYKAGFDKLAVDVVEHRAQVCLDGRRSALSGQSSCLDRCLVDPGSLRFSTSSARARQVQGPGTSKVGNMRQQCGIQMFAIAAVDIG
jgi:hypothetical protein